MTKIVLSANTDWYLYNFRLSLAQTIIDQGFDLLLLSPPGPYGETLRSMGMRWETIDLSRRGLNPFVEALTFLQYVKIYRRERPDLVHHFTLKPVTYGSLAAKTVGVSNVVNSITGLGYLFVNPGRRAPLIRLIALPLLWIVLRSRRGRTIFQNERDADLFESLRLVDPNGYTIIPSSGVDVERFRPSPEPEGEPIVLLAARMLWDKGVGELVEAARILRRQEIPGKVVLVGDVDIGNPATIEESQLRSWQQEGVVEWWGHQDDMPGVMARCHIVALPSYGEGVSRTLIEAAAAGRPIVASDVPGCREVVRDGWNGLLVPPKDPQALAEAIGRLLVDPGLRARMGEAGRQLAVERYSDKIINAETLRLYATVLGTQEIPATM